MSNTNTADPEVYKKLKENLESLNAEISRRQGMRASDEQQLKTILDTHKVGSVAELKTLTETKRAEADTIVKKAEAFISESQGIIEELDRINAYTGPEDVTEESDSGDGSELT